MITTPGVEQIVSMPVRNPDNLSSCSRTFRFVGKADQVESGKIIDWKGVSGVARFIFQRAVGFQGELYALCEAEHDNNVIEIEYRLLTRPTLKYSAPRTLWAVMKHGRKTAVKLFDEEDDAVVFCLEQEAVSSEPGSFRVDTRVKGDADRDAYERRCLEDQLLAEPGKVESHSYFIVPARLAIARRYLWDCCKRILECRRTQCWLPTEQACYMYNRQCPCAKLCQATMNGDKIDYIIDDGYDRFQEGEHLHRELEMGRRTSDGTDILTYTSVSTFRLCEARYYWQYELGLRPKGEYSEPLWIGSAVHKGLATSAEEGLEAGLEAIDDWAAANPVIGEDRAWLQDQQIARARAMLRAADIRWPSKAALDAGGP